jgi:hypothetical protein
MNDPNDEFRREEILGILYDAEDLKLKHPTSAMHNARRCLELACRFKLGYHLADTTPLSELLRIPQIKLTLGELLDQAHFLRKDGNSASHRIGYFDSEYVDRAILSLKLILNRLGFDPQPEEIVPIRENQKSDSQSTHPTSERLIPSWETLNSRVGQQALTPGERFLVELFKETLSNDWQIFVQPHFLGLRPDIVLLNVMQQVIHIEVKDWQLEGLCWNEDDQLRDERFSGRDQIRDNPILQSNLVRHRFLDGPLAGLNDAGRATKVLKSFLYFHCGTKAQTDQIFNTKQARDRSIKVLHRTDVEHLGASAFTTSSQKQFGGPESEPILRSLEAYLGLPEYVEEVLIAQPAQRRQCLTKWERPKDQAGLFENQQAPRPHEQTFERYRGGAGAGKSVIVALRAARAAKLGKKVLVTSLHITMANNLYGLFRRAATNPEDRKQVLVRHFHGFLYDQRVSAGLVGKRGNARRSQLKEVMEDLFGEKNSAANFRPTVFDAIYIDEGQDFDAEQIKALSKFLSPDGELILFADGRQDVHGKFRLWKRLPVPFKPWRQLNGSSQRLPDFVASWLNFVAKEIEVGDESDAPLIPNGERLFQPDEVQNLPLWWSDFENEIEGFEAVPFAIRQIQQQFPKTNPSDIAVLTNFREVGQRIVGSIVREFGKNTVKHIFGDILTQERLKTDKHVVRRQKLAFHQEDGRFKACTVHSFKGWESEHVVLLWTPISVESAAEKSKVASLFYTGASRCKKSMTILNVNPDYRRFRDENWTELMEAIGSDSQGKWRDLVNSAKPFTRQKIRIDDLNEAVFEEEFPL